MAERERGVARILVTGAAGFIGRALCRALVARGHQVVAGLRRGAPPPPGTQPHILGDIGPATNWCEPLRRVEVVVHLAQRAHRPAAAGAGAGEPEAAAILASAAAAAGIRRLVYLSSIKAMGEATPRGRPFRAEDAPSPADAYGRGKLASERALAAAAAASGLDLVVLRPPLVYGPAVRANFAALIRLAGSGLPLPFAAVDNRCSLIFLDNLADALAAAALHPAAAGRVFLVRDDADLSMPALIRILAAGQNRRARLFPVPEAALALLRAVPALGPRLARLTLSLEVDDAATRAALGWSPLVPAAQALRLTAQSFGRAQ